MAEKKENSIRFNRVRAVKIFGAVVAVYTVLGFFVLPPVVQSILGRKMSDALHRQVTINKVRINPYALSATLEGVRVGDIDPAADFLSFSRLYVNLQASSVFKLGVVVRELQLDAPYCRVVRKSDGALNFADLLVGSEPGDRGNPPGFYIGNISVTNGSIDVVDQVVGREHAVRDLTLAIPFLANMKHYLDIFIKPRFSAVINEAVFDSRGQAKPFSDSRESEFTIDLKQIAVPLYLAYLPMKRNFEVTAGSCDLEMTVAFRQMQERPGLTVRGRLALNGLAVDDPAGNAIARLNRAAITVDSLDLLQGTVAVSEIRLEKPELFVRRESGNGLNLLNLVPPADAEQDQEAAATGESRPLVVTVKEVMITDAGSFFVDASAAGKGVPAADLVSIPSFSVHNTVIDAVARQIDVGEIATEKGEVVVTRFQDGETVFSLLGHGRKPAAETGKKAGSDPERPWNIMLRKFAVAGYSVKGVDLVPAEPVEVAVSLLNLTALQFTTEQGKRGELQGDLLIDGQGLVSFKGAAGANPPGFDLEIDLREIPIKKLQAYLADVVKIRIANGRFTTGGRLSGSLQGNDGLGVSYAGRAELNDLAVTDMRFDDLVRWKSLALDGIDAALQPFSLSVAAVSLRDFFVNVIVRESGALNFGEMMVHAEKPDGTPSAKAAPAAIKVEKVDVRGGRLDFVDRNIKPNFTATLEEISGEVSGLSSVAEERAVVRFDGVLNGQGSLHLDGRVNPLAQNLYVDLVTRLKNIELSPATPFSGRYIGYSIEKGKLFYDAVYLIDGRNIDMKNTIFLDQFTLGEQVASPDAVKLPLNLGIALLKNRKGEIRVDLLVTGNLDDPEFRVGTIVFKMIANLLVKAVTSPFALLGAAFGSGEELNYVEFDAGLDVVGDTAARKLETLAKALYDRPALKLEIQGSADPLADREALAAAGLEKLLKIQKMRLLSKKSGALETIETVAVAPDEREKFLVLACKAADIPVKVKDVKGKRRELSSAEMEERLLGTVEITDDDLRVLAKQRALKALDFLAAANELDAARLFLLEPVIGTEDPGDANRRRVNFTIR